MNSEQSFACAMALVPDFREARGRICIAGYPRSGKTTLSLHAEAIGLPVHHTDITIGMGWSEASAEVATWLELQGPWIVEGVIIPRAARKWLAAHPGNARPFELLYWATNPWVPLTPGQLTMAKGCETVLREIRPELVRRGVVILEAP